MPIDFNEPANRERDKRLRRRLLKTLDMSKHLSPSGGLGAQTLFDLVNGGMSADQRLATEAHGIGLLRNLVAKGLVVEKVEGLRRGEPLGLRHLGYRITARGTSLLLETLPVDPDIDDDRVVSDGDGEDT